MYLDANPGPLLRLQSDPTELDCQLALGRSGVQRISRDPTDCSCPICSSVTPTQLREAFCWGKKGTHEIFHCVPWSVLLLYPIELMLLRNGHRSTGSRFLLSALAELDDVLSSVGVDTEVEFTRGWRHMCVIRGVPHISLLYKVPSEFGPTPFN